VKARSPSGLRAPDLRTGGSRVTLGHQDQDGRKEER
jgi:hypothetical protein